jgi:class 3 adenylate cyclase
MGIGGAGAAPTLSARGAAPAPAALPASFGGGRYAVRRFLGEGAKKRVYLAHDAKLDREVAFSLIKTDGLDADGLVRVRREAQAMGRLGDHPHIVTVFDAGDEGGAPYIVSQYRGGGSVEDLLLSAERHRIAPQRAMAIAEQVCMALEHAHQRSIVHRDLKPGNVWLDGDGNAALGDFGLAIAVDRSRMTMAGMMVGTVAYMAPEQALGRTPDARSDLYALGAMLYEMTTGRPPFLGDDAVGVISQHINTAPVAPTWHNSEVPQPLETLIMRLLEKSPEERPASAAEVAQELRRIIDRSTVDSISRPQEAEVITDLRGLAWGRFVGRREEMDQLKTALEDALSGKGSLAMLVGEPGIGKTRLSEEFSVYAGLRGAQVLTGRCYEGESSVPYRPFAEAFRRYARTRPDVELRRELGPGAPEVATLVSDVWQRFPDVQPAAPLEAEAERLRLFDSVTQFVKNAAAVHPLMIVLDDLHWADKPSLLLLQHMARHIGGDRLLLLGAYRDVELDRTHPLAEALATLRRQQNYKRVLLRGLPPDGVVELLQAIEPSEESAAGRQALAVALHQETEGNPFFIREVLSHLIETGKLVREGGRWVGKVTSVSELGIPEGVREVIGRRLSRLSEGCNRMLTLASTMTGGFTWEALKAISGVGPHPPAPEPHPPAPSPLRREGESAARSGGVVTEAELLDLLDEALGAQLIAERRGEGAGTYEFTHALIRQALYEELSTPRRVLLHRQIGEALERHYGANADAHLPELAHHFYQAAPGGDVQKAMDYARRAGDRATALLAHEEAAGHYERALQAMELSAERDERNRYELLTSMGMAYSRSALPDKSVPAMEQAMSIAESVLEPELFADAAVNYANAIGGGPLLLSGIAVPVLQRALARLGDRDPARKAKLLARMSVSHAPTAISPDERLALAREASDVARDVSDYQTKLSVLGAVHNALQLHGPERTEERLAVANEWLAVAEEAEDKGAILFARLFCVSCLAELGDMGEARRQLPLIWDIADSMREPTYSGWRPMWGCMLACMEGRYSDAEALVIETVPVAQRTQHPAFVGSVSALFYDIRRGQGRLGELEQIVLQNQREAPEVPVWKAAASFLYLDSDRVDEARSWFERLAEHDFADVPHDFVYMTVIVLATEIARRLGDERRAARLYEMLAPYAERNIVVGNVVVVLGSASHTLGQLAATMRRWDDAERHFEYALTFNEKIGAPPYVARTQVEYAWMLQERDAPGDRAKAQGLVAKALTTFDELGMKRELRRAVALKLELQGATSSGLYTSIDAVAAAVQSERPALPQQSVAPDGTVTIMFSDIEDSTVLTERLGDQRWQEVLRQHNAIVRECVAAHGGFEVKTMGDGFMVAFQSARRALECAVAIQRGMEPHPPAPSPLRGEGENGETRVRVRIGLHAGEALREDDDFYGKNVIMASRVAGKAAGGEILVSALLRQLVESSTDVAFSEGREVELKGLSGRHTVYSVGWGPAPD